jgi:hypothetical protein
VVPPKVMNKRFGPAITFYGTTALSFVIPSEAERLSAMSRARGGVWLWKRRGHGPLGKRCAFSTFPSTLLRLGNQALTVRGASWLG